MSKIILQEIQNIKEDLPKIAHLSDEYLFSLMCFKYFYNNGHLDFIDYADCFVDGKLDGGVDLITVNETDEEASLILIQSKLISKLDNKQDIVDIFTKMHQTFSNFQEHRVSRYNRKLRDIFRNKLNFVEDKTPSHELVLFINVTLSENRKNEISTIIEDIEELKLYQKRIFYENEIEEQIKIEKEPQLFVKEDKVEIFKDDGLIRFGKNGILVNVSANSIKDLYDKYRDKGLFEQNFRYFIRNKKIDESIINSLRKKRNKFWFLNNGIIIGCKEFFLDGDNVKLYDFSIINGCQTATLIGDYRGSNEGEDFSIPCKIVKPLKEEEFSSFISEIAEASNSQKPISDRDLKSNRPEQRELQKRLKEEKPEIYLEIKRGEQLISKPKRKTLENWQYLKNDLFGQIVLSFHLQAPGTARANKRKIFAVENIYDKIFKRKLDKDNIIDMLKLYSLYNYYLNESIKESIKESNFSDVDQVNVATNGSLIILAIIGFMIKEKRGLIDIRKISSKEEWEREISKDNLIGKIFSVHQLENSEITLNGFFRDIIIELADLYATRADEEKTVTNFFKLDEKYRDVILKRFVDRWYPEGTIRAKERKRYLEMFI